MTRYGEVVVPEEKDEVGYKGGTPMDAGSFYCPYVPLQTSGVLTEEEVLKREIAIIEKERAISKRAREKKLAEGHHG